MSPVSDPMSARFLARKGAGWVRWGGVVMAALAAAALATTVIVAQRALGGASTVVVRGECESLLGAIDAQASGSLDDATVEELGQLVEKYGESGLRYIAIENRDGTHVSEAGTSRIRTPVDHPGDLIIEGTRARFVANSPPRHEGVPSASGHRRSQRNRDMGEPPGLDADEPLGARHSGGADFGGPRGAPGERPPPFGSGPDHDDAPSGDMPPGGPHWHGGPPLVVFELEPPVIARLRSDVTRTLVVGAIAGIVLVGFAIGWSRSLLHLSQLERQAEGERRLVALGRMSSVMAHELKNPLASLKGHAQLLAEQLEHDPKAQAKAGRVVTEAERLEALTKSLLAFVRDGPLDLSSMKPADLIDQAMADLPQDRVHVDLGKAPSKIRVDSARAARALHNLFQNAIQATEGAERVEVHVTERSGDVTVEIRDHGCGLAVGSERTIFEPFVTTRVRGTGLGLPIARRIAEQHGGTLTGETHPDGGAVFRLTLPGAAKA